MAAEAEWGLGLKPPKWAEVGLFFLFLSWRRKRLFGKKGVKNQNGNDICHQRRPALCQPFTLRGGRSALQIGRALGLFHKWTGGSGHGSHTQPIRHSAPDKRPTPPPRSRLTGPKALNSSLGGGQPNVVPG